MKYVLIGIAIVAVPMIFLFAGMTFGLDEMKHEAIAHDKAEYITNEAGEQIWRWKP